jgi:hypothetical protein
MLRTSLLVCMRLRAAERRHVLLRAALVETCGELHASASRQKKCLPVTPARARLLPALRCACCVRAARSRRLCRPRARANHAGRSASGRGSVVRRRCGRAAQLRGALRRRAAVGAAVPIPARVELDRHLLSAVPGLLRAVVRVDALLLLPRVRLASQGARSRACVNARALPARAWARALGRVGRAGALGLPAWRGNSGSGVGSAARDSRESARACPAGAADTPTHPRTHARPPTRPRACTNTRTRSFLRTRPALAR